MKEYRIYIMTFENDDGNLEDEDALDEWPSVLGEEVESARNMYPVWEKTPHA